MKRILDIAVIIFSIFVFNPNVAKAIDEGCTPNGPFSVTTGKPCTPGLFVSCPTGHIYNTTTGKKCTTWYNVGTPNNPNTALAIKTTSIPSKARFGQTYSAEIVASGGAEHYVWSVSSGALPPGLKLSSPQIVCIQAPCYSQSNATISGAPTRSGTYKFTVRLVSGTQQATKNYSIAVRTR